MRMLGMDVRMDVVENNQLKAYQDIKGKGVAER